MQIEDDILLVNTLLQVLSVQWCKQWHGQQFINEGLVEKFCVNFPHCIESHLLIFLDSLSYVAIITCPCFSNKSLHDFHQYTNCSLDNS